MYEDVDIIVSTTLPTIDKLNTYKNGGDALILYFRYVRQARLQKTNTTYSKDSFMAEGMGWSVNKFYKVKKILTDNKLVETITRTSEEGKFEGKYIKVNFIISESRLPKNDSTEKPEDGKGEANAGSNKNKSALSNKYKYIGVDYKKQEAIDYVYQNYMNKIPKDKKKYALSAKAKLYISQLFGEYDMAQLVDSAKTYLRKTEETYRMAPQYFYSNTKDSRAKHYRPFIDYIGTEAGTETATIDTSIF